MFHGHLFVGKISNHETAKVGSCMATFDRGWKVAIELTRSAVWEPMLPQCWKPAMKLPRSAVWGHSAEKRLWNCQGWEHASNHGLGKLLKSGRETAKVGRLAVWERGRLVGSLRTWPWNCQGRQFESTKKCVVQTAKVGSSVATLSNFQIWQVYPSVVIKSFFNYLIIFHPALLHCLLPCHHPIICIHRSNLSIGAEVSNRATHC